MSIRTAFTKEKILPLRNSYPMLREWAPSHSDSNPQNSGHGPLVVLFTSEREGVALSGVFADRIGIPDKHWTHCNDSAYWKPATLLLESHD